MNETIFNSIKQRLIDDIEVNECGGSTLDMVLYSIEQAIKEHKEKLSEKSPRTAWTVKDLAEMCAKHDEDRLSGTMRLPYDTPTFELLIVESAMDKVEGRSYNKDKADQRAFNKQVEKACYLEENNV